jgi:hypothetical protein
VSNNANRRVTSLMTARYPVRRTHKRLLLRGGFAPEPGSDVTLTVSASAAAIAGP